MNNQKILNIAKLFKIFLIELISARAGAYIKQKHHHHHNKRG